ncbi:hypothetical protein IGI04_031915 [Brassica rapa subsp. trilocularis]|uniref:Uncharacterized protein n=1 Tax=Brassica rapa subsp. trilocularis TaxID=1813537 RepID=A0ABQ7KZ28_BRACM|nr:hypothetical protein IGI04_026557 [Brassica rapa subsp. trilocularis]KAG5385058.1 hypothetical protein IGI04_036528 [Brassica rapa subsp. trilocularis]KAG5390374.1 hypothetical protein IGI04_031915 [Brassica rapa subsp. trilocularis]
MDPHLRNVSQQLKRFKAAFVRKDYNSCSDLLSQLKVLLTNIKLVSHCLRILKGHETSGIVSGESVVEKAVGLEKDDEVANGDSSMEKLIKSLYTTNSGRSNQAPAVDLESEQPTASASSTGDAGKIALGDDEANQPCSVADEKIPTPT